MILAVSLFLIAVATFMCLGWGWAFRRVFGLERNTWPATVILGMAAIVFVGGILNLVRLAYPPSLLAIVGIGLFFGAQALRQGAFAERPSIVAGILIAAILIFTIATQLPSSTYNFHDDFQKYFAYPVRMDETGTVFGSPLSAMGLQTLGAQAFLDGFVVAFFPIVYINAVDAVFGLFLCLILATEVTRNKKNLLGITLLCVLGVVLINPQYVNISTLYCGSALIMAIVVVSLEAAAPSAAVLGVLYAALIAMKPIFAVFAAVHLLAMSLLGSGGLKAGTRLAIRTGFATVAFLLPWALIQVPHYWAALRAHPQAPPVVSGGMPEDMINLFSFKTLPYGSSAANYTALVAAIAISGLICLKAKSFASGMLACCATAVASFFIFVYILGPMHYGYNHGLRYYTTVAIGVAPPIFGFTALSANRTRIRLWLPFIVAAIPLAAFGFSFRTRIITALKDHTAASYSWLLEDPEYMEYNQRVLTGPERHTVQSIQERVPAGEAILAWINTPFYLDFRRNRIIDIDTAGIGSPWASLPEAGYLIWDYAGFATLDEDAHEERMLHAGANERKDAAMTLDFIRRLDHIVAQGQVLFDDGEVKLVRLKK